MSSSTEQKNTTFEFSADISQLMGLIVNSLYSDKDIALRELISNASDALDKIRYQSLTDKEALASGTDLKIEIYADKENGVLRIVDTGVGMTRDELIENLGTIAKSGTKAFAEALEKKDTSLIGQFGVGFYSAYLIADTVTVLSKHNDSDKTYAWTSDASASFSVEESDVQLTRGTELRLTLKDDAKTFLEETKVKDIVKRHSQFISYPIYLQVEKTTEREVPVEEEEVTVEQDASGDKDDGVTVEDVDDVESEESKPKPKTKTVKETTLELEQLNQQKPIWTHKPDEVSDEEHAAFYKAISNDWETYSAKKHFHVEGNLEFTGLLYLPKRAPFDMFQDVKGKESKMKLYVRRVFITDKCKELIPSYLSFVSGVVDSQDLPLNVSREILQSNRVMRIMKKTVTKRCLEMITELSENKEEYAKFYKEFSKSLKLGVHEDEANRDRLSKLVRFHSTHTVTDPSAKEQDMTSLQEYVERLQEGQESIYYITGESLQSVSNSPFLEKLQKKGCEVLLLTEAIDEYMVQQLKEFDGKKLVCITKEGLDLGDDVKQLQEEYQTTCDKVKELLENKVTKVVVSTRMDNSPCCLVTGQHGWSANMERIMKAQALGGGQAQMMMMSQKTLELNPEHRIVKKLKQKIADDASDATLKDLVWLLYETSMIASGFSLEKPNTFTARIHKLVALGIGCDDEEDSDDEEDLPPLDESTQGDAEDTMEQVD
jgi:molecular chaperone HtpG